MARLTIDGALRFWAVDRADQRAIWISGESLTYRELDIWVDRVAIHLAERGLRPGDRIAFYADTSLEWCVSAFAAMRCGGIVAPLNSRMVSSEVTYLIGNYEPALIFLDAVGSEKLADTDEVAGRKQLTPETVATLRTNDDERGHRRGEFPEVDPDAPCAIITTSGSTARPKGVVYSSRAMVEYALEEVIHDGPDLGTSPPRLLTTSPLSTAGGFNLTVHMVVVGGTVFLPRRFDPGEALELLSREEINVFRSAPVFFQRIAEHPDFKKCNLSSVKIATIGGAPPPPGLLEAWAGRGVVLRQLYGQTEVGGSATVNPAAHALSDPDRCGYGGPFTEIAVIDDEGRPLPSNEPGQIVVRKPGMMLGYWRNEEATTQTIVDGWARTGDVGVIDERGLLKMLFRMKDVIKSGGLNISAAEVEAVMLRAPGVKEAAIIGVPDAKYGETPLAVVFGDSINIKVLMDHCRTHLSSYKLPTYVEVWPEPLPRLAMGKISKPELRRLIGGQPLPPRVR